MFPADRSSWSLAPLFAAMALGLAGCSDTLRRSDFITAHTGDSIAANNAIQIVDPWRREAFDTRLPADGARASGPVKRYRSGDSASAPAGPSAPSAATSSGSQTQ